MSSTSQKSILARTILFDHDDVTHFAGKSVLKDVAASNENLFNSNIRTSEDCIDQVEFL
jgi:hypothetical protein